MGNICEALACLGHAPPAPPWCDPTWGKGRLGWSNGQCDPDPDADPIPKHHHPKCYYGNLSDRLAWEHAREEA